MNGDFDKFFKNIVKKLSTGLEGILSYIDRKMFVSLVNCLKYDDEAAVKDALNQLIDEKNKLAIAPIYLASKKHPNFRIRELCNEALGKIDDKEKIEKIVDGKETKEAVEELIDEYGNYRFD
jgi:HEAT repeat protein